MERAIVVRGTLQENRIDLDEPVREFQGKVEVVLRLLPSGDKPSTRDVFDVIASLPEGSRSKDEIDAQLASERQDWERA